MVTDQDVTGVVLLREWRANGESRKKSGSKIVFMGLGEWQESGNSMHNISNRSRNRLKQLWL
jgi:hypothetical protein